jgi:hypothetical protein
MIYPSLNEPKIKGFAAFHYIIAPGASDIKEGIWGYMIFINLPIPSGRTRPWGLLSL